MARDRLRDYFWFCKEHAREYNASWDYCRGLSEKDIEAQIRADTCWGRPTWPMGLRLSAAKAEEEARQRFERAFEDVVGDVSGAWTVNRSPTHPWAETPEEARALEALGIGRDVSGPVTLTQLKARYKELAKQLHPDTNGGDPMAEDRLKAINQAYAVLRRSLEQRAG